MPPSIDLSSASSCLRCGRLVTADGKIGGQIPVAQCDRNPCPMQEAARTPVQEKPSAAKQAGSILTKLHSWWIAWRDRNLPETREAQLCDRLEGVRSKREAAKSELVGGHDRVVQARNEYEAAGEARRRILRPEVALMLREHAHIQRRFEVLCENEAALVTAIGKVQESIAYQHCAASLDEEEIQGISELLDEAAGEADSRADALRELQRAGKRTMEPREFEDDELETMLAEFDECDAAGQTETKYLEKPEPEPFNHDDEIPTPDLRKEQKEEFRPEPSSEPES